MGELQLIPESAWIQAVFVVLFILLVVYMMERSGRQQSEWQSFMSGENEKWQEFIGDQTASTTVALERVKDCLTQINDSIILHDSKVELKISEAMRRTARETEKIIAKTIIIKAGKSESEELEKEK